MHGANLHEGEDVMDGIETQRTANSRSGQNLNTPTGNSGTGESTTPAIVSSRAPTANAEESPLALDATASANDGGRNVNWEEARYQAWKADNDAAFLYNDEELRERFSQEVNTERRFSWDEFGSSRSSRWGCRLVDKMARLG
jgi:hypothetical protein